MMLANILAEFASHIITCHAQACKIAACLCNNKGTVYGYGQFCVQSYDTVHHAVKVAPLWTDLHVCFLQQVLSFSDYLASGESFTEMCDRLQPLLGSCVNLDKVV